MNYRLIPHQVIARELYSLSHILSPFKRTLGLSNEIDFMMIVEFNHLINLMVVESIAICKL